MRRNRIWYGIVVATALLIFIIANRGEALAFLCGIILVPLVLAGIQVYAMRGFEVECTMRESGRIHHEIPFEIEVHRESTMPLGMIEAEVVYENIMYGEKETEMLLLQPAEKKDMDYQFRKKMRDCGSVRITLLQMKCYDKLGIFCWKKNIDLTREALVYPAQVHLNIEVSGRPQTTVSGEMYDQTRKGSDVSEVFGLRDYAEGDPLGSIHWKLSSKVDELVVREFGYPSNYNILILYDMMKECNGEKVANQRNNAVLAMTSALSYSMIGRNMEHNVGRIYAEQFQDSPVHSIGTHEQMVLNLLCRPITGEERKGDSLHYLLHSNLKNQYTKVIYITPEFEEEMARQLAREVDLTILQTVQGGGMAWSEAAGYDVIPIDADHYINKVHNIVV